MRLERRMSNGVREQLQHGPYSFLPAIARVQGTPAMLDLRFRGAGTDGGLAGEATLYYAERAAFRLRIDNDGLADVTGPAKPLGAGTCEGRVEARYAARIANAVPDRQTAFTFSSQAEKDAVLGAVRAPLQALLGPLRAAHGLRKPPVLGQEIDAVAIDSGGALAVVEVKDGCDTGGIGWAPIQVAMYARLMRRWIDSDPAAPDVLTAMLEDRLALGLTEPRQLTVPIDMRPVVAVGLPLRNEQVARARALAVAQALNAAGLADSVCEYWGIDSTGAVSTLW